MKVMVGLIHIIFFKTIEKKFGQKALDQIRTIANVPSDREFRMSSAYSDQEWQRLLNASFEVTNASRSELFDEFSVLFIADAVKRWPVWSKMAKNTREFLKLQPLIHNSFASGIADPNTRKGIEDKFRLEEDAEKLRLIYRSPNKLCDLYASLARELAQHYGDKIRIEAKQCISDWADHCVKEISFPL